MLYDAHCHLQDQRLAPFLPRILEDLRSIGVQRIVVNGTCEADWPRVLELAEQHDFIIPFLGLHPWYVKERTANWLTFLETHRCAVGEIGLDRWMEGYDSPAQEQVFIAQLDLAARFNRPVSIHCLRAWGRMLEILSSERLPSAGFLLHSYGGPAEMIGKFVELGGYFSFSGHFAHARKAKQLEILRNVPRERLLIETDAPDMSPPAALQEFHLGDNLNHPGNIRALYRFSAASLEIDAVELQANFQRLFGSSFEPESFS